MLPYTNEAGLRDYRAASFRTYAPRSSRWPWLALVLLAIGLVLEVFR